MTKEEIKEYRLFSVKLKKQVKRDFGKRCSVFCFNCPTCMAYMTYDMFDSYIDHFDI